MAVYYNEFDPFAAAWLRELIAANLIAPGEVDERSIEDVTPDDLRPFRQCHFFAGIGIWSLAARFDGWDDDAAFWSGSCPCQPFSQAGKGEGVADERHLWPAFHYLVEQCEPPLVVGEQVTGTDGDAWFDLVSADLDASGYAFGVTETCAAGFGAPHKRSRNYWMAHRIGARLEGLPRYVDHGHQSRWLRALAARSVAASGATHWLGNTAHGDGRSGERQAEEGVGQAEQRRLGSAGGCSAGELADAPGGDERRVWERGERVRSGELPHRGHGAADELAHADGDGRDQGRGGVAAAGDDGAVGDGAVHGMADAGRGMLQHQQRSGDDARAAGEVEGEAREREWGGVRDRDGGAAGGLADATGGQLPQPVGGPEGRNGAGSDGAVDGGRPGPVNGLWADADWLFCTDTKWRAVESGTFPLVDAGAFRNRVGLLRGAGNAINIAQAAGFLQAVRESLIR